MDQNSSNGSDADKRNWRERLGIGAKEMPKLSDEFRAGTQSAGTARPVPASGQPVTRPAPMAPRAPKAAAAPETERPAAPPSAAAPRATPRGPDNAAQEALAEKLRAQRMAAEKLAEQRVQAARERAQGKTATASEAAAPPAPQVPKAPPAPQTPRPALSAPRTPPAAPPKPRAAIPPPPPGARPKFSFAEETPPPPRAAAEAPVIRPGPPVGAGTPLNPPRPALGGEHGQPPFLRPAPAGAGMRPQTPYRPPAGPSAAYGAPPRLQPPAGRAGYGADLGAPSYPVARPPQRRPLATETYARQGDQRDYPKSAFDDGRQAPRLGRPARSRGPEDNDEVFEDDGAARPRPSAKDYQAALGEPEDAFTEDQRRSSGPWLLLLALLAAALVTGAGIWYYSTNLRDVAGSGSTPGDIPLVTPPEAPAKTAVETPAAGAEDQPAERRKQIYDRIVGEQEVTGSQIEPTEEIPVPPAPAQPVGQVPEATGVTPIPAPDAGTQGTGTQDPGAASGLPSVDEPPPLPLPPAGQEGSLRQSQTEQTAAAAPAMPGQGVSVAAPERIAVPATAEQVAAAPPPALVPAPVPAPVPTPAAEPTSITGSTSTAAAMPPPPQPAAEQAAVVSETAAAVQTPASGTSATGPVASVEPPAPEVAQPAPAPVPPPPKKKPAAKKKPPMEDLGSEPVILVPPSQSGGAGTAASPPTGVAEGAAPAPAPERKRRSIMDLFRGTRGGQDAPAAEPGTQVAAVEPPPPAAPVPRKVAEQPPLTGAGFTVQLSSFRSEAEAREEYGRLSSLYPTVVGGLPEQIRETKVGGSTRYQLGLGPLTSRSAATRVCSALITAGESDCIVRGR